jgi:hypothetical protein
MRPKGLWFPKLLSAAPLIGLLLGAIGAIDGQLATSAEQVPIVDGGAGPCSVEFTVTDGQGNPIYAATISVHIAYGFAGLHKLDLEAGTNSVGKARFTGLPKKVKGGSMFFRASQGSRWGTAFYDPSVNCTATEGIPIFTKH